MYTKRILLFLPLLLFATIEGVLYADEPYRPLLKIGKTWNLYSTNNRYEFNYSLTVVSDTIIDGDRCYRLTRKMTNQLTGEIMSEGGSSFFLEKDKKVYTWGRNKDGVGVWSLLYDFNLKEGDERTLSDEQKQKVIADEQVYVMGRTFRRLKIEETLEEHDSLLRASGYWVEGIGSSHGLLDPCNWTFVGGSSRLVSCYEDGQCVFTSADFENMPSQQTNAVRSKLLREGREWWYHDMEAEFNFEAPYDFFMYVEGDTLINGLRWKKVYRKKTAPVYEKAMREQGSRVYELRPGGQERLLFDFSLKVGDSYEPTGEQGHKMTVIAIDTVMVDSVARRRLLLMQEVNGVMSDLTTWTEGVGSECGIDLPAYWSDMDWKVVEQTHSNYYYYLDFLGCKDNSTEAEDTTYQSVLAEGLTWKIERDRIAPNLEHAYGYDDIVLIGDTIIDNIPFKRVYSKSEWTNGKNGHDWQADHEWIGEKDGKIYRYYEGGITYYPIVDFTLKVGDGINLYTDGADEIRKVIAVSDTILDSSTDHCLRRCLYVQYHGELDCWVEGIGSLKYGISGQSSEFSGSFIRLLYTTLSNDTLYACISTQHPVDMTSMIVNPRFDNNDVTTGWSGTKFGNYTAKENADMYSENYNTYQQIGGLQPGVYAVGVSAFYMPGNETTAYSHFKANDEMSRYAKLYTTGVRQTEVPIVSIFNNQRTEPLGCPGEKKVIDEETGQAFYIPNNLSAAERYMHELGCYRNQVLAMVDSSLVIGVKKESLIQPDWSVFDDFTLTYFGSGADAYQMYLDEVRKAFDNFTIAEGILYTEAYLDDARQYFAVHNEAAVLAALEYIENAYAKLQENINLWKKWQAVIARGRSLAAVPAYQGHREAQQLSSHCTEEAAAIEAEHKLTNEELAAAISETEAMINALYSIEDTPNRMLAEGKQWMYTHHQEYWDSERMEHVNIDTKVTYTINGDTLIGGKSYAKLYYQEENEAPHYCIALREENGAVYRYGKWYDTETEEDRCYIEFNPCRFSPSFMNPCATDATERIDMVTVNNRQFVRHSYNEHWVGDWYLPEYRGVEGVGFELMGILGMDFKVDLNNYLHFDACYENGECIFTANDFGKNGDDPVAVEQPTTHPSVRPNDGSLYDLQGRKVKGQPARGIYIKDGKKVAIQ